MDVFSIGDEHYRMITNNKGLQLNKINGEEAKTKLTSVFDNVVATVKLLVDVDNNA